MRETPFDSIESALEFVDLLARQTDDVRTALQQDLVDATDARLSRHLEALRLVDYKLTQLSSHLAASRRILNDLRMLRRLLVRDSDPDDHASSSSNGNR